MGQLNLDFEGEPELPKRLREWFWRCQSCAKYPPRKKQQRKAPNCPKCGAEMSKVVFDPSDWRTYVPLDQAVEKYQERLAEDRRRIEALKREDPEFARRMGFL